MLVLRLTWIETCFYFYQKKELQPPGWCQAACPCEQSRVSRTPYPQLGSMLSQNPKFSCHHRAQNSIPPPLRPQRKIQPSKLKYEALEITEIGGFWKKSACTSQLLWVLFKQMYLQITTTVGGLFESKGDNSYITVADELLWKRREPT